MGNTPAQSVGSYLYGVTSRQPFSGGKPFKAKGIEGQPVRIITQGDLAAIVSNSSSEEYEVTLDNVRAHEDVVEKVLQRTDVLPVSFGTVASSDQVVQERLLGAEASAIHAQLQHIAGRVEMGVKALWEQPALFAQIAANDPAIQRLRDEISGTTVEESYDARIELGELTDAAIQAQRAQDAEAILDYLGPLAVDTYTTDIVTDMMILNASFLVERNQAARFAQAVEALGQANRGRITLKSAGPLPPYNFVSVVVQLAAPEGQPNSATTP